MKTCIVCGAQKRASAFPRQRVRCRDCLRTEERTKIEASWHWIEEYARRWRRSAGKTVDTAITFINGQNGQPQTLHRPPHFYYRAQHDAIMAYGGYRCVCCGEGEPMLLTLDHVNNDGSEHRRQVRSNHIFVWLRKRGYPTGLRVLCWNCNCGRHRNGGECPHRKKRRAKRRKR